MGTSFAFLRPPDGFAPPAGPFCARPMVLPRPPDGKTKGAERRPSLCFVSVFCFSRPAAVQLLRYFIERNATALQPFLSLMFLPLVVRSSMEISSSVSAANSVPSSISTAILYGSVT